MKRDRYMQNRELPNKLYYLVFKPDYSYNNMALFVHCFLPYKCSCPSAKIRPAINITLFKGFSLLLILLY